MTNAARVAVTSEDDLRSLGLSLAAISLVMVPLAVAWTALSFYLGRKHVELRDRQPLTEV